MTFFPSDSILLTIGGFSLHWYAVTLIVGVVLAYLYMGNIIKSHGYETEVADELLIICLIGGFLGGRIVWVLEHLTEYQRYLPYVFAVGDGGYEILGTMLGVVIAVRLYLLRRPMSLLRTLDSVLPAVLLFGAITRIGRAIGTTTVWYTILIDLIGFGILHFIIKPYHIGDRRGDLAALSLMWIGLSRLIALIFGWDPYAANSLIACIIVEALGIFVYFLVHTRKPDKPVILFDLDGTIMDSHEMVIRCFSYLFKQYSDISLFTPEIQKEVFGPDLKTEMAKLFPEQDPEQLVEEYRQYQSSFSWSDEVSLFPHVKETLDLLWKSGYVLGIVSTRMTASCESWLRQLDLSYCFQTVIGRDLYEDPKPEPDGIILAGVRLKKGHDSCIYVGDNLSDVEAAKAAGVYAIAFMTDLNKKESLIKAEPNKIITDMAELLDVLLERHEWSYEKK